MDSHLKWVNIEDYTLYAACQSSNSRLAVCYAVVDINSKAARVGARPNVYNMFTDGTLLMMLQVYGVTCNPFAPLQDTAGNSLPSPAMFVTYGVKHIKFWVGTVDEVSCNRLQY